MACNSFKDLLWLSINGNKDCNGANTTDNDDRAVGDFNGNGIGDDDGADNDDDIINKFNINDMNRMCNDHAKLLLKNVIVKMPEANGQAECLEHLNNKENQLNESGNGISNSDSAIISVNNNNNINHNQNINDNSNDSSNNNDNCNDDEERDLTNLTWLTECSHQTISLMNITLDEISDNIQQKSKDIRYNEEDHCTIYPNVVINQSKHMSADLLEQTSINDFVNINCNNSNDNDDNNNNNQNMNRKLIQRNNKKQNKIKKCNHNTNNSNNNNIVVPSPHQTKTWQITPLQRYEIFINKIKKDLEVYQQSVIDYQVDVNSKPPFNYSHIIGMAMLEGGRSTLRQICTWIERKFAFFRIRKKWNNSIRHNLSLHPCFRKISRKKDEKGKGGYWELGIDDKKINRKRIRHRRNIDRENNKKTSRFKQKRHINITNADECKQLQAIDQINEHHSSNGHEKIFVIDLVKKSSQTTDVEIETETETEIEAETDLYRVPVSDCQLDTIIIRASPSISSATIFPTTEVLDLINTDLIYHQPSVQFTPFVNQEDVYKIKNYDKDCTEENQYICCEKDMSTLAPLKNHVEAIYLNKRAKCVNTKGISCYNTLDAVPGGTFKFSKQQEVQQNQQEEPQQERQQRKDIIVGELAPSIYGKNIMSSQNIGNDNILSYMDDTDESFRYLRNIHNNCCDDNLLNNILDISVSEL